MDVCCSAYELYADIGEVGTLSQSFAHLVLPQTNPLIGPRIAGNGDPFQDDILQRCSHSFCRCMVRHFPPTFSPREAEHNDVVVGTPSPPWALYVARLSLGQLQA